MKRPDPTFTMQDPLRMEYLKQQGEKKCLWFEQPDCGKMAVPGSDYCSAKCWSVNRQSNHGNILAGGTK